MNKKLKIKSVKYLMVAGGATVVGAALPLLFLQSAGQPPGPVIFGLEIVGSLVLLGVLVKLLIKK